MQRKDFMKFLGAAVATGSIAAFVDACKKDTSTNPTNVDFTIDLSASANSALNTSGGAVISNNVIVINNSGNFIALSDICTHQGCALSYSSSAARLNCPCHGASFRTDGSVINGPASTALKVYSVTKSGNTLHITG